MFSRLSGRVVVVALALILIPTLAAAQATLGRVAGTVLDSSGGVLPGATVTLTNTGTGQVLTAASGQGGAFLFPQVPVGTYRIKVELESFKTAEFTDVTVAVGQEYSLTAKLEIGTVTEVVTVAAGASLVQTTTPEVTSTVMQAQVLNIPLANRDITNLIKLQAGVQGVTNRANTSVNGGRPTWTQVTLDGINIQDNFIRANGLDFLPNRPTSDNVGEFSITTSVAGADNAGGTTSVRMVTPSGTNRFTGSLYEFNRDNKFSANQFFTNASQSPKPELSRHQFGGRAAGPVMRDKLFFFFNYEGFRQTTQTSQNLVVPVNPDFYNGVFRYSDLAGNVQSVNVLQLSGLSVDPTVQSLLLSRIPQPSSVNNYAAANADSTATKILNTAGYLFNQSDISERNQYTGKVDFNASNAHKFEGVYSYFKETDDRTDLDIVSPDRPLVYTISDTKRLALAWRWAGNSRFNNELRGGFHLAPVGFGTDWDYDGEGGVQYHPVLGMTSPIGGNQQGVGFQAGFLAQGRYTDTYQMNNTASYVTGNHQLQMGGSWQRNRVNVYNFAGQYPQVTFGFSAAAPTSMQLTGAQFPGGISAADLARANTMAAFLGGVVTSVQQTFQVRDSTSGFVPGIPSNINYTLDNINIYVQDNWRWKPNFTVRAGLKWEYYSPIREDDNLGLLPQLNGRSFEEAMRDPGTILSFPDGEFYEKDLNNFGPNVGFAWDLTRDGRTALRGGYSLSFVNEDTVTVGQAVSRNNSGLTTVVNLTNQFARVSEGVPVPATPTFLSERTLANQVSLGLNQALWGIDPGIENPHVHQVSIGLQRELPWSFAGEIRYVGTFGREIWRGIDFNQVTLSQEFRDDFARARQNLFNTGSVAYNPNNPASQPLTVLSTLGSLTNSTLVTHIQQNQLAGLADFYLTGAGAAVAATARPMFFPNGNSGIYASQGLINGAFSDYNSLQAELRRQFRNGLFAQVNYTYAVTNTNSAGTGQNRFEAFMDNGRPDLNTGRSIFENRHVMNGNAIYELPFGRDRRWLNGGGITDVLVGGWQIGTILTLQSGSPISIISARPTFNRLGRSDCLAANGGQTACNTAVSSLSVDQIRDLLGIYKTANGNIYWIDPKVIDSATGRGAGVDNLGNTATFDGQVFFNPGAGEVGGLPVMAFDGPSQFRIDLALSKRTRILSRYALELKAEAFNLTNTPSFFTGDMNINSTTFGRLTTTNIGSRVVQFSARFDF
jgi:hypothetical protein